MAAEQIGEALLTPFLLKTYQLVDDPAVDDSISWNGDGSGFIIWRPEEFARDLLPKYFKHNNLSSFVRQLNTYGFRKVVPDRWEFANDFFKRGEKGLLRDIQRRKMTLTTSSATPDITSAAGGLSTVQTSVPSSGEEHMFSSSSSPVRRQVKDSSSAPELVEENEQRRVMNSTSPELVKENERLEKENQQMTNELSHLRGLCSNIFTLMSGYGPSGEQDTGNLSMESKQLDLLQSGRYLEEQGGSSGGAMEDISPKLFGVSIGAKRRKLSEEDEIGHRQHQQDEAQTENHNGSNTAQSEMKQEPGLS